MHINYRTKNGIEYAMAVTSVRKGSSVVKEKSVYLGRVTDKEAGIYRSRDRGLFMYDINTNTFHPVPDDYAEPETQEKIS